MIAPDKQNEYIVGEYTFINYVNLNIEQKLEILNWRNQDIVREKMYNTDIISQESHLAFIDKLPTRTDCSYWYISKNGQYVGSYNITSYDEINNVCETGLFFKDTSLRGLPDCIKISLAALELTLNTLGICELTGFTKHDNYFMLSINKFIGLELYPVNAEGFVEQHLTACKFKSINKSDLTFRKYINQLNKLK